MNNRMLRLLADNRRTAGRRFEVTRAAAAGANEAEVFLYDAIVDDQETADWIGGVAPEAFVKELRALNVGTIHLRINSPGGSVFAARTIEQALREHKARVVVHIDGLAASAATFIAMAGDEVVMGKGAMFMIHKAWTLAYGNADDLLHTAGLLEKIDSTLADTYAARTGKDAEQIGAWMAAETWFTAQEAVDAGFADRVAEDAPKAATAWNLTAYGKPPAAEQDNPPPAEDAKSVDAAALMRRIDAAVLTA
jgi:ATP-dependent Clp protease protease subunit